MRSSLVSSPSGRRVGIWLGLVAWPLVGWIGLSGCSPPSSSSSADTRPVLVALTNNVILPTLRDLDAKTGVLVERTAALSTSPSADTLSSAQAAWRDARASWERTEAFRFGPAETKSIPKTINFWPVSTDKIDQAIAGSSEISAAAIEALGANATGFLAIEYLLFDAPGQGDAGVLVKLTTDALAERRRAYVAAVAQSIKGKSAELLRSWEPSGENFAKEVMEAGQSGTVYPSAKSAIDQIVNSASFAAELVTNTKIGTPFGNKTGGTPAFDQEETPRSDNSIADMVATMEGVRSIYSGTYGAADGEGISDLVRAKSASLDDRVVAGLNDSLAKIGAIPPPFRTAIVDHRDAVQAAYEASRAVKNTLTTEVAGALGTTLKFNDNDGD